MSHDYGWEEAKEKPHIIPQITRKLSSNVKSFLVLVFDKDAQLPMDYFDGNKQPYKPDYMKREKAKRKPKRFPD